VSLRSAPLAPSAPFALSLSKGLVLFLGLLLAACPAPETAPDQLPRFQPLDHKPTLALVLGSGGPRGFAHIGVLKVLEENGVKPDLIVGSSVGAVAGALYASGIGAADLQRLAQEINVAKFFELGMLGIGHASGVATQKYVNAHVGGKPIESLKIPFAAAATRVRDGKLVLFNRGDTGLAVRASSANSESFKPVRIGDEEYVDGDDASPVPIHAARMLGARVVIAVDVSAYAEDTPPNVPREWVEKDARRARQIAAEAPEADLLLHPNIGYYAGHNEEYRRRVIALAEAYTRKHIPQIRAAVERAAQVASTARAPSGVTSR
jgi:NTE family protein